MKASISTLKFAALITIGSLMLITSCSTSNNLTANLTDDGIYYDPDMMEVVDLARKINEDPEYNSQQEEFDYFDPNDSQSNPDQSNYSSNYGYNSGWNQNFGFMPNSGFNMGWNSNFGWNMGFGCGSFYDPFYDPFYNPYWGSGYYPMAGGFGMPGFGYNPWGWNGYNQGFYNGILFASYFGDQSVNPRRVNIARPSKGRTSTASSGSRNAQNGRPSSEIRKAVVANENRRTGRTVSSSNSTSGRSNSVSRPSLVRERISREVRPNRAATSRPSSEGSAVGSNRNQRFYIPREVNNRSNTAESRSKGVRIQDLNKRRSSEGNSSGAWNKIRSSVQNGLDGGSKGGGRSEGSSGRSRQPSTAPAPSSGGRGSSTRPSRTPSTPAKRSR